jgi:hypothetical protein
MTKAKISLCTLSDSDRFAAFPMFVVFNQALKISPFSPDLAILRPSKTSDK